MNWVLGIVLAVGTVGATSAHAGAVPGPKTKTTDVQAYSADAYRIVFRGGEKAEVIVRGDHDTVLRVEVYDENDNLIGSDTDGDSTGIALVTFYPRWTGVFKIRVVNTGGVYNDYTMVTN